jgi:hypothetical protein
MFRSLLFDHHQGFTLLLHLLLPMCVQYLIRVCGYVLPVIYKYTYYSIKILGYGL